MTPLQSILTNYRATSQTEREKGSYFEELIRTYFRNETRFADLYSDVWLFADWAKAHGFSAKDTGIDGIDADFGADADEPIFHLRIVVGQRGLDADGPVTYSSPRSFTSSSSQPR